MRHASSTRRGIEIHVGEMLSSFDGETAVLSGGTTVPARTLVWTTGVKASPLLGSFGLPLDDRGRVRVDSTLRVEGHDDVWSLGDCAAVPNAKTPGRTDPPTCQHALRQARRLAANLTGTPEPYGYRMLGQVATLGRFKGIADVLGIHLSGFPGWFVARTLPPLRPAPAEPEAPRRRRLDDGAVLPARHRRALEPRPSRRDSRSDRSRSTLRPAAANAAARAPARNARGDRRARALATRGIHPPERDAVRGRLVGSDRGARLPGRVSCLPRGQALQLDARLVGRGLPRLGVEPSSPARWGSPRRTSPPHEPSRPARGSARRTRVAGSAPRCAPRFSSSPSVASARSPRRAASSRKRRSARVSEKLGYRETGISEISPRGIPVPHHDLRLDRKDWVSPVPGRDQRPRAGTAALPGALAERP